jgi:hypothetical protein
MIERNHPRLSVGAQCRLLSISRSSFYYAPQGETAMNLDLMLLIDRQFLETPFYGVRQMGWHLQNEGHAVNEKRIRRLMRLMRLMPIYQKPNTSKPAKGHKTYPYLLGGLRIDRPNQVWCSDITYLPMRKGFLYLVAIMDWFIHGDETTVQVLKEKDREAASTSYMWAYRSTPMAMATPGSARSSGPSRTAPAPASATGMRSAWQPRRPAPPSSGQRHPCRPIASSGCRGSWLDHTPWVHRTNANHCGL